MTEVGSAPGEPHPRIPGPVSALPSSPPKPKRLLTRMPIIARKRSTSTDLTSPRSGCSSSSTSTLTEYSTEWKVPSTTWKRLILTLDGGGIRGYSSLILLRALMREIERIEQSLEPCAVSSTQTDKIPRDQIPDDVFREGQYLPCHYFDYIAGTSLGGLIAIMLGMLGMSVDDCIKEFHRQNKAIPLADDASVVSSIDLPLIFRRSTWPTKRTRSFFDTFAKFTVTTTTANSSTTASTSPTPSQASAALSEFCKDAFRCQTIAWCTKVEARRSRRPYAFRTFADENDSGDLISIPEVAKAITTPSRYSFKPFKLGAGQFVDGSKQIRDPTLEVLKEITWLFDENVPATHLLLSLGTDEHHTWFYEKLRSFITRQPTSTPAQAKEAIDSEKDDSYLHYHRFEVPGIKLGWRKKFFITEIEDATEKWLSSPAQKAKIAEYARMLVERRRARAATARWERFALGVRYVCFHEGCAMKESQRVYDCKGSFYDHLDRRHALSRRAARRLVGGIEEELSKGRRFGWP